MSNYQGSGIVYVGGSASALSSHYSYTGNGGLSVSGGYDVTYEFFDLTCESTEFSCIVKVPTTYKRCFTSRFFKPQVRNIFPGTLKAQGAYVAASTMCRQYPFIPVEPVSTQTPSMVVSVRSHHHYYHQGIGGIICGGKIPTATSETATGGMIIAGTGLIIGIVFNTGSGGSLIAGVSVANMIIAYTGADVGGGVVVGGLSVLGIQSFDEIGSGGIISGGVSIDTIIITTTGENGIITGGDCIDDVESGGSMYFQLSDTFTTGGVADPADNGPVRNLLAAYGSAYIEDGELKWEQKLGSDVNPSIMAWNNLEVGGNWAFPPEINIVIPSMHGGVDAAKIFFACQDNTFQDGYCLYIENAGQPVLRQIVAGVESDILLGNLVISNSGILYIDIQLDGGTVYCEMSNDGTSPDYSIIYETPITNAQDWRVIGLGLYGSAADGATTCDSIAVGNNNWLLLDTFYQPSDPGASIEDYNADSGQSRTLIAGDIVYSANGIGATWANDGSSTEPAIFSYGSVAYSITMTVRLKNLTAGDAYIYFNCDATFENGWYIQVNSSDVTIWRLDAGVPTQMEGNTWTGNDNQAPEARLVIETIGGNILVNGLGFDGGSLDDEYITLGVNMGGFYETQDVIGIGMDNAGLAGADDQIFYFRVN